MINNHLSFAGLNFLVEELHHFGVSFLPDGITHSIMHHGFGGIGYVLLAYGFYKVYRVAKGVSSDSINKPVQKETK